MLNKHVQWFDLQHPSKSYSLGGYGFWTPCVSSQDDPCALICRVGTSRYEVLIMPSQIPLQLEGGLYDVLQRIHSSDGVQTVSLVERFVL